MLLKGAIMCRDKSRTGSTLMVDLNKNNTIVYFLVLEYNVAAILIQIRDQS